jgi:drug/metabolite transporter (DMT)-like permease
MFEVVGVILTVAKHYGNAFVNLHSTSPILRNGTHPLSRSVKAHILLVFVTLCWGTTFVQVKCALNYISPLSFNFFRMGIAAVAMCLVFHKDLARLTAKSARAGAFIGILLWLSYQLQTIGLKYTTPSKSAFLTGICVVLVPLLLALFFHRHINRWTSCGALVAFAGLFLMAFPAQSFNLKAVNGGDVLSLGCAVCFAFQIILLGRATQKHSFRQIAAVQITVCAFLMAAVNPALKAGFPSLGLPAITWNATVIWALLVTALLCTVLAFSVQAWAQQFTPPSHAALILSTEPVFAALMSWLYLGETLGVRGASGAGLILAGVLISELKGSEATEMREETGSASHESDGEDSATLVPAPKDHSAKRSCSVGQST